MNKLLPACLGEPKRVEVVRLITSYWKSKRGYHFSRSLIPMRRLSEGFQLLEEDVSMVGVKEVLPRITNLHSCEDGLYYVETCNESRDWETGHIDEYDYKLIPCPPTP